MPLRWLRYALELVLYAECQVSTKDSGKRVEMRMSNETSLSRNIMHDEVVFFQVRNRSLKSHLLYVLYKTGEVIAPILGMCKVLDIKNRYSLLHMATEYGR